MQPLLDPKHCEGSSQAGLEVSGLGAQVVVCDFGQATSFTEPCFTDSMGTMASYYHHTGVGIWKTGSPPQSRFGTWGWGWGAEEDKEPRGRQKPGPVGTCGFRSGVQCHGAWVRILPLSQLFSREFQRLSTAMVKVLHPW